MKEELVSVIIPCYNVASYVEEAVMSMVNQTYKNLEIICIDDGSKDETKQILNELAKRDSRINVFYNETNLGLIYTLNKGISIAKGEYIARMDADDISLPTRIEREMEMMLADNTIDVISVFTYRITEKGKKVARFKAFSCTQPLSCKFMVLFDSPIVHPGIVTKKSTIKQYMFNDSPTSFLVEDFELWVRMLADNLCFKVIPKSLYLYRINTNSVGFIESELRTFNYLQCSKTSIKKQLGVDIDDVYHRIILSRPKPTDITKKNIVQSLATLDRLKKDFLLKNNCVDQKSLKEINNFTEQRKLFILTNILAKSPVAVKPDIFFILLSHIYLLFRSRTWTNIRLRLAWVIFSKI